MLLDAAAPDSADALMREALMREARTRTRRRRARVVAGLTLLAGIAVTLYALLAPAGPGVIAGTADSPRANVRAFSGHGELAFVSRDQLWLLDGSTNTLRHLRVPAGYTADAPMFSHDGRWLAYVVESTSQNYQGTYQLWLAHANGDGAHRVAGVRLDRLVGWSARADVVAATVGQQLRHAPYGSATAVDLVSPDGRVRTLVRAPANPVVKDGVDAVGDAVWSPSGAELAVSLEGLAAAKIETVSAAAPSRPTVWFQAGHGRVRVARLHGRIPTEVSPQLEGWSRGSGIAFWVIDFGQSRNLDDTPLAVIHSPGTRPRLLGETLSTRVTDAIAQGAGGRLALVATVDGGGRAVGSGKAVETCSAGACHELPGARIWPGQPLPRRDLPESECKNCWWLRTPASGTPGSGVSEDPAWSPDGKLLAYVKAPTDPFNAWPSNAWFAQHAIYVWDAQTDASRRIGKVNGSALPTWSRNGKDLMYESDDGLWLMPLATGRPVEIVHPLYPETEWNNKTSHLGSISFNGQIPWQYQFSWWSAAGS